MDTLAVAVQTLEDLGLGYSVDRLAGRIVVPFEPQDGSMDLVVLLATATSVEIRAPRIAGTGGQDGKFDMSLAALAAMLTYRLDLQLGVDFRDGEIEGRLTVPLAPVEEALRVEVFSRALEAFLSKQEAARMILADARQSRADTVLASLEDLSPCA